MIVRLWIMRLPRSGVVGIYFECDGEGREGSFGT